MLWRAVLSSPQLLKALTAMMRRNVLIGGGALALAGGASYAELRRMGSMSEYNASVEAMRAALPVQPQVIDLIRYATLAPNGHNTQPWKFHVVGNRIEISPDFGRRTPIVDPDDHHIFVSLGCAAENLALAAAASGHPGEISFNSANNGSVVFSFDAGPPTNSTLFEAIPHRQSTRAEYDRRPVGAAALKLLAASDEIFEYFFGFKKAKGSGELHCSRLDGRVVAQFDFDGPYHLVLLFDLE